MYCINVKEQFDVSFMIKAPIFSQPRFDMFQACSVLESTYYLFRILAMLSFSATPYRVYGTESVQWGSIMNTVIEDITVSIDNTIKKNSLPLFKRQNPKLKVTVYLQGCLASK